MGQMPHRLCRIVPTMSANGPAATVRLSELLAALSLGIDLGFGQPMEHVLRQCRIALRICGLMDVAESERPTVYYTALLVNVGCHTDAHEQAHWFGDDIALRASKYQSEPNSLADIATMLRLLGSGSTPLHRLRVALDFAVSGRRGIDTMITGHARLARSLGEQLGLSAGVMDALAGSYERWDGKGFPGELAGADIPLGSRIVQLAEFMEVAHRTGGERMAVEIAERRAGKQFDPTIVARFVADVEKVFHGIGEIGSWDAVIDDEPSLTAKLSPSEFEGALTAIARFVDLKSPYTLGHSESVADLAGRAGEVTGMNADEARQLRRAALVSGFGRLGLSNAILDKRGALSAGEWERMRLQPHLTERILHQSGALEHLSRIAVQIFERLDGSGYPRGLTGSSISRSGRLLAVANAYRAMLEPRPHRAALSADDAAAQLRTDVAAGRLDAAAVDAVLQVAGHRVDRRRGGGPAGLTEREVEVLCLLARGLTNKEIGARLMITPKTAGNHIEHIFVKIAATTRAEAGLFAMQHGLLVDP